ncbi:MAG: ABC transporter ATP-binding protein, partial [Bacteroidota bacterium]|nr:ABC transporter ATP-binding protein [Bacteroidota bacterium]
FIVYLILFILIIKPAKDASTAFYSVRKGLASVDRIIEVQDVTPSIIEPKNSEDFPKLQKGIRFENVSFAYEKEYPVLKNITCFFEKGKTTAIVGPSGS